MNPFSTPGQAKLGRATEAESYPADRQNAKHPDDDLDQDDADYEEVERDDLYSDDDTYDEVAEELEAIPEEELEPVPARPIRRRRSPMRTLAKFFAWLFGIPAVLLIGLYLVLLVTPVPLPFVSGQIRNLVMASMPAGSQVELGEMALALENFTWPVVRFSPVVYTAATTGAKVRIDALEVGFSPVRAFVGQPGATVTIVRPHLQVHQDIFGPRLVSFAFETDPATGAETVQVLEGTDAFPQVTFGPNGIEVDGDLPASGMHMRSDNDWLVYNLEGAEKGISGIVEQANLGRFSRLVIRDASLDLNDALYGVFRTFKEINVDIRPAPDGKVAGGNFSANFAGTVMNGILERVLEDNGESRLKASITNLDLGAFMPASNDPTSMGGVVGPSAVSLDIGFNAATGKMLEGKVHIDLTGMDVRVGDEYVPIATSIMEIDWDPALGQFTLHESQISVGENSGYIEGVFKLGFDERYGPMVSISASGRDIAIASEDGPQEDPFKSFAFRGWSAPLYGATGIDHFAVHTASGGFIEGEGRADMVREGPGFVMDIRGDGLSADEVKRVWPASMAKESRDWFVKSIVEGKLKPSTMRYNFPVGVLAGEGEEPKPLPDDAISINIAAQGLKVVPMDGMDPISVEGDTRMSYNGGSFEVFADGGKVVTTDGDILVANASLKMAPDGPEDRLVEISGDVSSGIPALIALVKKLQPDALAKADIGIPIESLGGSVSAALVSTSVIGKDEKPKSSDFVANGIVTDFGSAEPLDNHTIRNGQFSFTASQASFEVKGQAEVDGLPADVMITGAVGEGKPAPEMLLSATLDAADFKKMGFDVSQFIDGQIKFVAKPMPDKSIQVAVDLDDAAVTIKDLGITKAKGVKGSVKAQVLSDGDLTTVSHLDAGFGDVKLVGSLSFDTKANQLKGAEFTSVSLSKGDNARLAVSPSGDGGYKVLLRGKQFDMKPMLKRFFSLGEGSTGGPQATAFKGTIAVDAELERALGFFKTTAFNVDLDLAIKGKDILKASLSTQFGEERSLSVTTNPTPEGRVLNVAFNDLGTVLRLLGVYPNLEGGRGTLVLQTLPAQDVNVGNFELVNFSIVNEDNVNQIVGNHRESVEQIAKSKKMVFRSGEASFVMHKDRVELREAVLAGDSVGGTARGTIYTERRQYDISGTYVPMFGLNNVLGKLLGPLAGRDGEGLLGITFAIEGPLDKPEFKVNPVSALAPGAFRRMFEFRQDGKPN